MSPMATDQGNVSLFFDFGDIFEKRVVGDDMCGSLGYEL
jgi:hypothetical protein